MKKLLALLVFALFVTGMVSATDSPYYAKTVFIQKITSHEKGYRVAYYNAHGDLETIYVPIEWFYKNSNYLTDDGFVKAEIVRGVGPSYPYMQIFWKDGKFHHLRLFVRDSYADRSWGVVRENEEASLGAKFDPAKPVDLQF